jgi:hypothetical protein
VDNIKWKNHIVVERKCNLYIHIEAKMGNYTGLLGVIIGLVQTWI